MIGSGAAVVVAVVAVDTEVLGDGVVASGRCDGERETWMPRTLVGDATARSSRHLLRPIAASTISTPTRSPFRTRSSGL